MLSSAARRGILSTASGSGGPIKANMVAWFRKGLAITAAASAVSAWADQSGRGHDLLQGTGGAQPTLQAGGSIVFDGVAQFMKCATFTLVQPTTIYVRMRQLTWTLNRTIFSGNSSNVGDLYQNATTPRVRGFAGTNTNENAALALNTWGSVGVVFNGASSIVQVDGTQATGDAGAGNMAGFTLGAGAAGTAGWANVEIAEVIVYNVAHDATAIGLNQLYLNGL